MDNAHGSQLLRAHQSSIERHFGFKSKPIEHNNGKLVYAYALFYKLSLVFPRVKPHPQSVHGSTVQAS